MGKRETSRMYEKKKKKKKDMKLKNRINEMCKRKGKGENEIQMKLGKS